MYRKGLLFPLLIVFSSLLFVFPASIEAAPENYDSLKKQAENLYTAGSFEKSKKLYEQLLNLAKTQNQKRWVKFRFADSSWRSLASTNTYDNTKFQPHEKSLLDLLNEGRQIELQDQIWADVAESLGDYYWTRNNSRNWYQAWPFYQKALNWWGGQAEGKLSRSTYLKIVWKIAEPPQANQYYYYGYHGNYIPIEFLYNAKKIAKSKDDKARINYLVAMTLSNRGQAKDYEKIIKAFNSTLSLGKSSEYYDDALYHFAQFHERKGKVTTAPNGSVYLQPDLQKAVELYRRYLEEFRKGESRYVPQANSQLKSITDPQLSLHVSNTFLPDSEITAGLNWRNLESIEFALFPIDLASDVQLHSTNSASQWAQLIRTQGRKAILSWKKDSRSEVPYQPQSEALRLEKKLPKGAYVIEARAGSLRAQDVILVTDSAVLLKTSNTQAIAFVTDALSGKPLPESDVTLWQRYYQNTFIGRSLWVWKPQTAKTNKSGIAHFELQSSESSSQIFVGIKQGDSQAFAQSYSYSYGNSNEKWKLYVTTDRPAYRPEDTVQWKITARINDGYRYSTPANSDLSVEIYDAKGSKIKTEDVSLNKFGSAWGSIELNKTMPLGEYRATFYSKPQRRHLGSEVLFRLEEFKLPEFKVAVKAATDEDGMPRVFKLGETVHAQIDATYYFGGAVANADVEVVVHKKPFYHHWAPPQAYPWFYDQRNWGRHYGYQPEEIVTRKTLKTDEKGKVQFEFDTPNESQQDLEYRIEARVIDSSRREVSGADSIKVTRMPFFAYLNTDKSLINPKDKATITLRTIDANNRPISSAGKLSIWREVRKEVWQSPQGANFSLQEIREKFPNDFSIPSERKGWVLKSQGHERKLVDSVTLNSGTTGEAIYEIRPGVDGHFAIRWEGGDNPANPIFAETIVWAGSNRTTDLDYRSNSLQLVVDNDTQKVGSDMPIMIASPVSNRWVLFTAEAQDIYDFRVVHLAGTAALIHLPVNETLVPNVTLQASMISDGYEQRANKQIIVPPEEHYLTVEIETEKKTFRPREETTVNILAKDHLGNPVAAEIGLSVVDESVFYIQQDYSVDPRKFFFGEKRNVTVQTRSSFNEKRYISFTETESGQIVDSRQLGQRRDSKVRSETSISRQLGSSFAVGGMIASDEEGAMMADAVSAPAAYKAKGAGRKQVAKKESNLAEEPKDPDDSSAGGADIMVRSDFRSTALWEPSIATDANGRGKTTLSFPDSLTSWKLRARAVTAEDKFGTADDSVATSQPLMARLQAPRFFVVGDQLTLSAILNNNTNQEMKVRPRLKLSDEILKTGIVQDGEAIKGGYGEVTVPANGEYRLDWFVAVKKAGDARIEVSAVSDKHRDAMVKTYPVVEHGIEKLLASSTRINTAQKTITLNLPKDRRKDSTKLELNISPSIALTMLDSLPYLAQYPYGCTEQTMSRFLPAVVTLKTMQQMGVSAEDIAFRVFGGITPGSKTVKKRKKGDLKRLEDMVDAGLKRLYSFQHSDGGWGWWRGGSSDAYMTAYVVWGLTLAKNADVQIKQDVLQRGVNYLDSSLVEYEEQLDVQSWMLHALGEYNRAHSRRVASQFQRKAFTNLFSKRTKLNAYTRSLLALSAHNLGYQDEAKVLIDNLENGVVIDNPSGSQVSKIQSGQHDSTAHWGSDGVWWRWSEGGIESTSFALKALSTISPNNELIAPTLQWLVANRRGAQWSNTRDTAYVILALNQYLQQSKELGSNVDYEILINGTLFTQGKVRAQDLLNAPRTLSVPSELLKDGENKITLRKVNGDGTLYLSAKSTFFSLEEPIKAAGNRLFVTRKYYRLVNEKTLLSGVKQKRVLLKDGEEINSGDRVEVVLAIEAKNNYEYLVFEDKKPAGFESVQLKSGESMSTLEISHAALGKIKAGAELSPPATPNSSNRSTGTDIWNLRGNNQDWYTGRSRWVHQELRDQHIAVFVDKLPQGVWEVRYQLRAEVPGNFHALPTIAQAMYVPELRANSDEARVRVIEKRQGVEDQNNSEE